MSIPTAPAVRLKSGIVVANFSSPHVYNFDDGSILDSCPESRVEAGSLEMRRQFTTGRKGAIDVRRVPQVTPQMAEMLDELEDDDDINVVLVSAYVLRAINGRGYTKPRTSWMTDQFRQIISSTEFGLDQEEK